ncbi:hypothetical protein ABWL39_08965 [Chitinivorax sp. PXF-14]|uniref:hypothetical protein n=1 Tax=Chitinivorax sp. PXF-14 TaxID=3230488 RepID=UPI003465B856
MKALSTPAVATEVASFEKSMPDKAALARQMGFVMPALDEAKTITCEAVNRKARLIVGTETVSETGKRVPVSTVVMFEQGNAQAWLVGEKAMTDPFSGQSVNKLLQHPSLKLP